jgi:hypothetical protein
LAKSGTVVEAGSLTVDLLDPAKALLPSNLRALADGNVLVTLQDGTRFGTQEVAYDGQAGQVTAPYSLMVQAPARKLPSSQAARGSELHLAVDSLTADVNKEGMVTAAVLRNLRAAQGNLSASAGQAYLANPAASSDFSSATLRLTGSPVTVRLLSQLQPVWLTAKEVEVSGLAGPQALRLSGEVWIRGKDLQGYTDLVEIQHSGKVELAAAFPHGLQATGNLQKLFEVEPVPLSRLRDLEQ